MELIGKIARRSIYYLSVRNHPNWKKSLPKNEWVAFTIANPEDEELVPPMAKYCLEHGVGAICSAGELAYRSKFYFDEEIVWRNVNGHLNEKEEMPLTSASTNFDEGFLTATAECGPYQLSPILLCLDLTKKKVKNYLGKLIVKINEGWIPEEKEVIQPEYDFPDR